MAEKEPRYGNFNVNLPYLKVFPSVMGGDPSGSRSGLANRLGNNGDLNFVLRSLVMTVLGTDVVCLLATLRYLTYRYLTRRHIPSGGLAYNIRFWLSL